MPIFKRKGGGIIINLFEELNLNENCRQDDVDLAFKELKTKNKSNIFAWKVLRDKYYKEVYKKYLDIPTLIKAGFIDDKLEIDQSDYYNLNLLTTPVGKILNNIKTKKTNNPIVLVSTGGFNPLHEGHLHMMELAKRTLEENGFEVIGGYFSPSHDSYVSTKPYYNKDKFYRINKCREYIKDNDWIMIDPWESIYVTTYINFTDVINRLELYLKKHIDNNIQVAYVCGGDNVNFMYCFENIGMGVCVNRKGYNENYIKIKESIKSKNIFFCEEDIEHYNFSSRNIRKSCKNPIDNINKNTHNGSYIIRNEGILPLSHYKKNVSEDVLKIAQKEFLDNFVLLLKQTLDYQVDIKTINVNEQLTKAAKDLSHKKTISLDNYYKGTYNLSISRMFDISDTQDKYISLIGRIGCDSIEEQFSNIAPGEYILVDDDSVTGNTLKTIRSCLPKNINTSKTYLLSEIINDKIFDVIDLRDFIIGSQSSGLVVRLPNREIVRVPYVLPYVSLRSRASIPSNLELKFSLSIWKLNKRFYEYIGKNIRLSNISEESIPLFKYIGFIENTPMIDICNWHINKIENIITKN